MTEKTNDETKIAVVANNIQYIQRDISEIKISLKELTGIYMTREEFEAFRKGDYASVKRLVFGAIGLIMAGVIATISTVLFKK